MSQHLPSAYVPTAESLALANSMHDHRGGPTEALFCVFNLEQDLANDKRAAKSGIVPTLDVDQCRVGIKREAAAAAAAKTGGVQKKVFECAVPIEVNQHFQSVVKMEID